MAQTVRATKRHSRMEFWPNLLLFGSMMLVGLLPNDYSKILSNLIGPGVLLLWSVAGYFRSYASDTRVASVVSVDDRASFVRLVSQWRDERGSASSIEKIVMCYSYQRIIAMGEKAVPLILQQIENDPNEPDHWFWALRVLTGANPVNENDRGDMRAMARSWLEWGRAHGW